MIRKRLFIVDHMCVLPYGHNLNAMSLFKKELKREFSEVQCWASKKLSVLAEQSILVIKCLYYPYEGFLPSSKPSRIFGFWGRRLHKLIKVLINRWLYFDITLYLCKWNYRYLFKKNQISSSDIIFFPSADYYGVISLIEYLSNIESSKRPSLHIRLIGVSENARYSFDSGRPEFFAKLKKYASSEPNISFSAETPKLASYAEKILNQKVQYFPYPLANHSTDIVKSNKVVISSPGQGRIDKGYFRLLDIIIGINLIEPAKFKFIIQPMNSADTSYRKRYQSRLSGVSNIELTEERLSQEEIDKMYLQSSIILLPYDERVYQFRGSAVYQESLSLGRLAVVSESTGVAEMMKKYGNGVIAKSNSDFVDGVLFLSNLNADEVSTITSNAREMYVTDLKKAIENLKEILR